MLWLIALNLLLLLLTALPAVAQQAGVPYYPVDAQSLLVGRAYNQQQAGNPAWAAGIRNESQPRIYLSVDGTVIFGPGGSTTQDIMIKRLSSTSLAVRNKTDTLFLDLQVGNLTAATFNGAPLPTALTTPVSIANGGTALAAVGAANTVPVSNGTDLSYALVGQPNLAQTLFLPWAGSSLRALPSAGNLDGDYWHVGNWASTGVINCTRCRWHVVGTVTLTHDVILNTELEGGYQDAAETQTGGGDGVGLGGGNGAVSSGTTNAIGGGGGGYGGRGGNGGSGSAGVNRGARGGQPYYFTHQLAGSGGGAACTNAGATPGTVGGAGGGGLLIEATGAVSIEANITGTGGAGVTTAVAGVGAGGGGSGGGVDIRSYSTVTLTPAATIALVGGAGGGAAGTGGAGGGGGGGYFAAHGTTVTNNGTVTLTGGAAGAGGANAATAGSAGVSLIESVVWGPRTTP